MTPDTRPEQLSLFDVRRDQQLVSNARQLRRSAFSLAVALHLVFPISGRSWTAVCSSCLESADPHRDAVAYRLAETRGETWPEFCQCCPYTGCDTLVAALLVT